MFGSRGANFGGNSGGGFDPGDFFSSGDVQIISDSNAKSKIGKDIRKKDGRIWTVMFYAPWCGHCQKLKPEFLKFAKMSKGVIQVGGVDCESNRKLCAHYKVQGYPTILSLIPDNSNPEVYNGPRTAQALYDHSQRLIPGKSVAIVASEEQADLECQKDPKKVCIVLLSEKATPTPLTKALAYRVKDFAKLIQVKVPAKRKTYLYGDAKTKIPSIFVNRKLFTGLFRMDNIYNFILTQSDAKQKAGKKDQL